MGVKAERKYYSDGSSRVRLWPALILVVQSVVWLSFLVSRLLLVSAQLTNSANGPRLCISLLDRIASLFEVEESSDSTRAFDLGYVLLYWFSIDSSTRMCCAMGGQYRSLTVHIAVFHDLTPSADALPTTTQIPYILQDDRS